MIKFHHGDVLPTQKVLLLALALSAVAPAWSANVLTQHNDPARTGANLKETELTPARVKAGFGKLFSRRVHGQIYAQPLVVSGVEVPGKGIHNVVYVATMRNDVYAFDADDPIADDYLWKTNLGKPLPYNHIPAPLVADFQGYNIKPTIGITSTPVVDAGTRRMWVVAKSLDAADHPHYNLNCLAITNGAVLGRSHDIRAKDHKAALEAETALQRPGLLLANNTIYLGFGSHQDAGDYSGWVVAFDADSLAQKAQFCTTPGEDSGMAAIWQSGNGLAADAQGNVYCMTGNGIFDSNKNQFANTFLKLTPDLQLTNWFTPWNYEMLSDEDLDLSSAGPMLLPDTNELVGGGKEGWLYLLDRDHMGNLQPKHRVPPPLQQFKASDHWTLTWLSWLFPSFGYHHIHGSPVYWKSAERGALVYVWPEQTRLKAFQYDPVTHFKKKPMARGPKAPQGMPGGFLSISANGDRDGIIWATSPLKEDALIDTVRGVLRAFDAITLKQLWSTDTKSRTRDAFNFAKTCPPTIANGKVYLATFSDKLNVYGLLTNAASLELEQTRASKPPKKPDPRRRPGQTR